jgi:hypothetical protein
MMEYLILVLALGGLVGCYDIARRMTARTRHSMRLAVIMIGIACVLAMLGEYPEALATLLAGCGLYRIFDLRTEGWHVGRDHRAGAPGLRAVPDLPPEQARRADEFARTAVDPVGSRVPVPGDRQDDHVARRVAA